MSAAPGEATVTELLPAPKDFFVQLVNLDQGTGLAQFEAQLPAITRARASVRGRWRDALPPQIMSKATFDAYMKDADRDADAADRANGAQSGGPRPEHDVNVSFHNPFRYSLGTSDFRRGVFERVKGGDSDDPCTTWQKRASLPYVHARVVRRDGTRRRIDTEYLMSAEQDGHRVLVGDDELTEGQWARKLGANLSSDRDIITAAGTAIRDVAHRWAPEKEAVARLDAHTASGHLDIPVAECLPAGYLTMPPMVTVEQARDRWRELVAILADRPKMALVLGASVGAPFVGPLRRQSHWVDLFGDSQKGKSTTQAVAAAVWGDPTIGAGIVSGWDATSVGIGRLLGQLGILPPFFDERKVAPFEQSKWGEVIYSTCQGSSRLKAEANSAQGTHKAVPWFGILFSTGNHRLTDGISAGGFAGIPPRVVELSAPFTADQAEAERIAAILTECYGWLGQAIMEANTLPMVRDRIARAVDLVGAPECGGVPGTLAKNVHVHIAGAMMGDELLGTGSALTDAAVQAAREYLEQNGHEPVHDSDRMAEGLAESLTARRSAWPSEAEYAELNRPVPAHLGNGRTEPREAELAQHGYDQQSSGIRSDDGRWLYVFPSTWRQLVDELGTDSAVACAELYRRGHLHVADSSRRRGEWHSIPRVLGKATRVYQVAMTALEGDPAAEPGDNDLGQSDPESGTLATLTAVTPDTPAPAPDAEQSSTDPGTGLDADTPGEAAETASAASTDSAPCPVCSAAGPWCGSGTTAGDKEPCILCGQSTLMRSRCGAPRHAHPDWRPTGQADTNTSTAARPGPHREVAATPERAPTPRPRRGPAKTEPRRGLHLYGVLDGEALTIVADRRAGPPEPLGDDYPANAAECVALARRLHLEAVWVHESALSRLDVTGVAESGWEVHGRGDPDAVELAVPARADNTWADAETGRELAAGLAAYESALSIRFRVSPAATGLSLLGMLHKRKGAVALVTPETLPPAEVCDTERALSWCRALTDTERGHRYVHGLDKHGAYLGAASDLIVGLGDAEHVTDHVTDHVGFDSKVPGMWRVSAFGPAPDRDDRLPHPWIGDPAGSMWRSTATLAYAAEQGAEVTVSEAWVWPSKGKPLSPFYRRCREGRTRLMERAAAGEPGCALALSVLKETYSATLGGALASRATGERDTPGSLYRPDWRSALVARARVNLLRNVDKHGVHPFAADVDQFFFTSDSPDPASVGLPMGDGLGEYGAKTAAELDDAIRTAVEGGRLRPLLTALGVRGE